jgi:hypothetical protein
MLIDVIEKVAYNYDNNNKYYLTKKIQYNNGYIFLNLKNNNKANLIHPMKAMKNLKPM